MTYTILKKSYDLYQLGPFHLEATVELEEEEEADYTIKAAILSDFVKEDTCLSHDEFMKELEELSRRFDLYIVMYTLEHRINEIYREFHEFTVNNHLNKDI